jgi:hypothetical protein
MKKSLHIFILTALMPLSFIFASETGRVVPFEKGHSDHIQEIFTSWSENEGPWLYESMSSLVMDEQHPERPMEVNNTTFELLQKMDDNRKERVERIANTELENERNGSPSNQDSFYWEKWLKLLNSANCDMSNSRSSGDPHVTTFDGEKYDFQTAGDYLLTSSSNENFVIQTQQVRHNEKISVNGSAFLDVNGDEIELFAQNHPDEHTDKVMRINGTVIENEKSEVVLEHGGVIRYKNGRNVVNWPTGEQLHFSVREFQNSKLLDLTVFVPGCRTDYRGLLGDNNGDREDDTAVRDENGEVASSAGDIDRSFDALFGSERNNQNTRDKQQARLNYISRDFGDQFVLDEETSRFTNQMIDLTDEERYPTENLTLAEMTDEEVEGALDKCREAGVPEEDLFECAFDYGYVGLEPLTYPEYLAQQEITENTEPQIKKENNNNNDRNITPTIRIGTGVFRPVGTPRTTPKPPNRNGDRNIRQPRTGGSPRGGR